MENSVDDFEDLGTEARLAVRLAKAGAVDSALGFLVRRVRDDFGSCKEGLDIVIEELREQVPQCFIPEEPDPMRTKKMIDALPTGHAELMAGLTESFRKRKEVREATARARR